MLVIHCTLGLENERPYQIILAIKLEESVRMPCMWSFALFALSVQIIISCSNIWWYVYTYKYLPKL